jgi:hypothetical protein
MKNTMRIVPMMPLLRRETAKKLTYSFYFSLNFDDDHLLYPLSPNAILFSIYILEKDYLLK